MHSSVLLKLAAALSLTTVVVAADPQCVTQGAGSCNGVYTCESEIDADNIDCYFTIYDNACNIIGSAGRNDEAPDVGTTIDSTLPYTVDITEMIPSYLEDDISAQWAYAGGNYGKGVSNSHWDDCSHNLIACSYVRAAFPC